MKLHYYKALVCRLIATASALFSGIISLRLFGKYLMPETYGVILVALQTMAYLPMLDGGIRTVVNRSILAEVDSDRRTRLVNFCQVFNTYFAILVVTVSSVVLITYSFFGSAQYVRQPVLFFFVLGISGALSIVSSTQMGLLIGLQSQPAFFLLTAISSWLNIGALWACFHLGVGVWAFPFSVLAGIALVYPATIFFLRKLIGPFQIFALKRGPDFWSHFNGLKSEAWSCFRNQIFTTLLFTFDVILVGLICSPADAAVYGVLSRLFSIVRSFLQTTSEVAWPLIAQERKGSIAFTDVLSRLNAWLYASVLAALCITVAPFLGEYMGGSWVPKQSLVSLMTARFLITGLSSPFTYSLWAEGEFKILARFGGRELIVAVVTGTTLGLYFGVPGVALGFLIATSVGNLWPVVAAYTRVAKISLWGIVTKVWGRASISFVISALIAATLAMKFSDNAVKLILVGGVSVVASLLLGVFFAWMRVVAKQGEHRSKFAELVKNI